MLALYVFFTHFSYVCSEFVHLQHRNELVYFFLNNTERPNKNAYGFLHVTSVHILQERADPDWANASIKPFQYTSRRKKALTLGPRKEKFRQRNLGSNPGPLALRTSALTTELSRHSRELR